MCFKIIIFFPEGGSENSKLSQFQNCPNCPNVSQIQKSPNRWLEEGGVDRKLWTFSIFCDIQMGLGDQRRKSKSPKFKIWTY